MPRSSSPAVSFPCPTCTSKKTIRRLWAKGKGHYRVIGRYASTTVRGTWWLTADRCDGTLASVKQGTVAVRDVPRKKTVLVTAGHNYLAAPK